MFVEIKWKTEQDGEPHEKLHGDDPCPSPAQSWNEVLVNQRGPEELQSPWKGEHTKPTDLFQGDPLSAKIYRKVMHEESKWKSLGEVKDCKDEEFPGTDGH